MESAVGGWLPFLGNLHPLLLHLPIGLILVTGLLEIFSLKKRREVLAPAITTLLWLSAISCILSVGTGWLMAVGKPAEITLDRHLWLTVILTALVLITLNFKVIFEIGEGKGTRLGYRISLVASIGLLSLAAHQGGSMVHGKDHLTEHLPEDIKLVAEQGEEAIENAFTLVGLGDPEQMEAAAVAAEGGLPTGVAEGPEEEALAAADVDKTVFEGVILPILEGKCTKCHNEKKSKGKLRMHTFEHLMAGGSEGDTIVPGDLAASLLAVRIDLPLEDDEAMPPEDEKPLTEEEKELLKWWITNGASSEMLLAEAEVPAELETAWNNLIAPPEAIADAASETEVVPIEAVARSYSDQEISEAKRTLSEKIGGLLIPTFSGSKTLSFNALNVIDSFGDEQASALKPLSGNLEELNLARTQITDQGLEALADMAQLKRLHLENTAITDAGLDHLGSLEKLEYLNLYGTKVTDEGIRKIMNLPALTRLYVWQTEVSSEAANALSWLKPELKVSKGVSEPAAAPAAGPEAKPAAPAPAAKPAAKPEAKPAPAPKPAAKPAPAPKPAAKPAPAPKPAAKPAPKPAPAQAAAATVNRACPITREPVNPDFVASHSGKRIGFANAEALKTFQKDPAKYFGRIQASLGD